MTSPSDPTAPGADAPLVSAVMPTYNMGRYISAAVAGILSQTYTNWELVIVDDGSTDDTAATVARISDARIRYVRLDSNEGRGAARNVCLAKARGSLIAVTDADDISLPNRFEKQVAFLRAHPDVGVVSGQLRYFSAESGPRRLNGFPQSRAGINAKFRRGVMGVAHPASMVRRSVIDALGGYSPECRRAQDLEFFLRASDRWAMENLPDVLILYRSDPRRYSPAFWIQIHLYHDYAGYRHKVLARGQQPLPFAQWRQGLAARAKVYTWHMARYVKHAVVTRFQWQRKDPAAAPRAQQVERRFTSTTTEAVVVSGGKA